MSASSCSGGRGGARRRRRLGCALGFGWWARRRTSAQALAMRSRIVLACAQGRSNTAVADELGVSVQMVGKWRARFVQARLDGLADDPRPGRPSSITGEQVEDIVVATLESTPAN